MRWFGQAFGLGRDRERSRSRPRVASAALAALAAHERQEEWNAEWDERQDDATRAPLVAQGAAMMPTPWPTAGGRATDFPATGLGSARAGAAVYLIPPAGVVGPDGNVGPALMRAAVLAAHEAGRRPDEVWEEALSAWLLAREERTTPAARPSAFQGTRRQETWGEIEATVRALRAS